jgi:HEAT repeat protein
MTASVVITLLAWSAGQAAVPPSGMWQVTHKGRTIVEWYNLARDQHAVKLEREGAIQELGKAGQPGAMALWQLLGARDTDTIDPTAGFGFAVQPGFVRLHAAFAFGGTGRLGLKATPKLAELMRKDPVVGVRRVAAFALGQIGPRDPKVIQALKDVLNSTDYEVWQGAAFALGRVQPRDQETFDLLTRMANIDPDRVPGVGLTTQVLIMNARLEARSAR